MSANTYVPFTGRMISKYEGGYGWNKRDPGGPTKFGVTCYDLAQHRGQKMDSMARWAPIVALMDLAEAEAIFKTKYATGIRYDDLPAGADALMMDYAVNSGVARPILVAHRLLGVPGSGMSQTLVDAIKKTSLPKFINDMCNERLSFMHAIRGGQSWAEFGGGWSKRVADLRAYCLHIAVNPVATAPDAEDLTHLVQPKATNVAKTAGKSTTATAVAAGGSAAAAGLPHWQIGAVVAGVFLVGILYEAWQDVKTSTANSAVVIPEATA
jgi:lysozyme family protein